MAQPVYLDYAAATPLDEEVFNAMQPYLTDNFYNPSALYEAAINVRNDYEEARHDLAKSIGAKQHEIIITAGASESINLALRGVAESCEGLIAAAPIEHAAVIETAKELGLQSIAVTKKGLVTADAVKQAISPETVLVSVGYINNELGTVQPLRDIADVIMNERQRRLAAHETRPIYFHTDASQAPGLIDCSVSRLGVDMMTLNSSKCYGPKQVGLLWAKAGVPLHPQVTGGNQERSLRAGTENVAGTIGFAKALTKSMRLRKDESPRIQKLRDVLENKLVDAFPKITVNGHTKKRAPHILHVSLDQLDGERVVYALDQAGVMAATGSACAANSGLRSHVLVAAGFSASEADGSLRFSIGRQTTTDDMDRASSIIIDVIRREQKL